MKKLLLFLPLLLLFSFITTEGTISKKEKKSAARFLKETEKQVLASVKGLNEAQLKFKPAPNRWSVEECLKHIAVSEQMLWKMIDGTLKAPANPEKRSEIKATDEDVMKMIEDRSHKVQTIDPLKPENTLFKSAQDAEKSFKADRAKLIEYVKSTNDDLRSHVAALPVGSFDCYQLILFVGAHSNRHMQQIEEVKADPNFPKQ
jgi:uncharacterized damage-inducible protein DinB